MTKQDCVRERPTMGSPNQLQSPSKRRREDIVMANQFMLYCDMVLEDEERKNIIEQYEQIRSYRKVAKLNGISANTVKSIVNGSGEYSKKKRGRRTIMRPDDIHLMKNTVKCLKKNGEKVTAGRVRAMCELEDKVSISTVRRYLRQDEFTDHHQTDVDNEVYNQHSTDTSFTPNLHKVHLWDKLSLLPFLVGRLMHSCYEYFFL